MEIDDTPPPTRRRVRGRYDKVFDKLKLGQCIKTDPDSVAKISGALRHWIDRNEIQNVRIKIATHMADGYGRVWLLRAGDADD